MYKKIVISIFGTVGLLTLGFLLGKSNSNAVVASENLVENKNNALTMMLETDVDSNEYEVATSNEWPQEGYIFNAEMSACERGGTLSWDSENNRVLMASGSADKCYVYFDRYTTVNITNVTTSNITNNSITLTVEATVGESQIATYYFSSNDGVSYEESINNTYTFNNLETGIEYNFRVYAVDTNGICSNIYTLSESTSSILYLANYIKNEVYTGDGNEGIYYHDGRGTYTNATQEAGDNSYRYAGANPNNYVCFGSDGEVCPNGNLYRIIGVFDNQVKLIRRNNYRNNYWTGATANSSNVWSESRLNTTTLNVTYLNSFGSNWVNMISVTTWSVGGLAYSSTNTVKQNYNLEVGANRINTTYSAKIGLMYVSDYGYATSPAYWTTSMTQYDSNATSNNWLYYSSVEWTITRATTRSNAFCLYPSYGLEVGGISTCTVNNVNNSLIVRPVFYLYPWVIYSEGDGSSTSPFRISIPDLISFSLDGETYYFEDGMTWEEWVNSIYNIDNFVISNGYIYDNSSLQNRIANQNTGQFAESSSEIDSTITWYWY